MSIKEEFKKFSSRKPSYAELREEYDYVKGSLRDKCIPHFKLPEHLYQYQELFDNTIHVVWTARRSFVKLIDIIDYLDDQFKNMIELMDEVCNTVVNEIRNLEENEERKERIAQRSNNIDLDVNKIIKNVNTEMDKIKDLKKGFEETLKGFSKE